MDTQVSWIEPDQLRSLVDRLQGPARENRDVAWEVHTLPDAKAPADGRLAETAEPAPSLDPLPPTEPPGLESPANDIQPGIPLAAPTAPPAVPQEVQPAAPQTTGPAAADTEKQQAPPELDRIRQRLQAIRERAVEAGLITQRPQVEDKAPGAGLPEQNVPPPAPAGVPIEPAAQPTFIQPIPSAAVSPFQIAQSAMGPTAEPIAIPNTPTLSAPLATSAGDLPFMASTGSVTERLQTFAEWAMRRLGAEDLLLVDDHGDVLWGRHANAELVVSALLACTAALRSDALGACKLRGVIQQPFAPGKLLIVVPCPTPFGVISLATVRGHAMDENEASALKDALTRSLEPARGPAIEAPFQS